MGAWISAAVYGLLSGVTLFLAAAWTNRRIKAETPKEEALAEPYHLSGKIYLLVAAAAVLSAACGYRVMASVLPAAENTAAAVTANLEVGVCYLAVLAAAVTDFKLRIIPNVIPIVLICARLLILVYELIFTDSAAGYLLSSLLGCLLCFVVLGIANRFSKGGIGGGDIKLLSAIGFVCGIYVVFSALFLALVCCLLVSMILILQKKKTRKDSLPLGPFLFLGYVIMCLLSLY